MSVPPSSEILERNLGALAATCPQLAARIRQTPARPDVEFVETDEGVASAVLGGRALASKRRPLTEAKRLSETIDPTQAGVIAPLGFGMGYHVGAVGERMGKAGCVLVFEPDVALLRAVLERVDHSAWIGRTNLAILTDPDDASAMAQVLRGVEGVVALGVKLLEHPAQTTRLGPTGEAFGASLMRVVKTVRTTVLTTLVHAETTVRNLLMNADHYATSRGIGELKGSMAGRPAVVVSAGPSLKRNIDLLARPGVRDRVVIVCVQTVLKQLLARGIRPHFVTALDHHEISRRFYEGLTASDVEGVTLIGEPKANAAILDAFPGAIRCPRDEVLDDVLGGLGKSDEGVDGKIDPGATVAHLAYFFARHLGCDPVILTGQDLGFTDGQYYASGAAIHDVWACELNRFRTLEMFEWERIARQKSLLQKTTDVLGRSIYTDEQMSSYLVEFERAFASDAGRGLTTIDATEGGVAKAHTQAMTLGEALALATDERPVGLEQADTGESRTERLAGLHTTLADVWRGAARVATLSREASEALGRMLEDQNDQSRVNALIKRVDAIRGEVTAITPAYDLVQQLNQSGALNRFRADRALHLAGDLTPLERQRKQIERDLVNVKGLAEAADRAVTLLDHACGALRGEPKLTRDAPASEPETTDVRVTRPTLRTGAIVFADPHRNGLGRARDLATPVADGRNALQMTLDRLASCDAIDDIVILSTDPDARRGLVGDRAIEIMGVDRDEDRAGAIASARLFSPTGWRGGIAGIGVHDEVFEARAFAQVMERANLDVCVPVGADWSFIDPAHVAQVVERVRERPDQTRLAFTQGAPGLGVLAIARSMVEDLARVPDRGARLATIGSILSYQPSAPQHDPIASSSCVQIDPRVRDVPARVIADDEHSALDLVRALKLHGLDPFGATAEQIASVLEPACLPTDVTMELCTGRAASGERARWTHPDGDLPARRALDLPVAERLFTQLAQMSGRVTLTLDGAGDATRHPRLGEIIACATSSGIAGMHLRTDLLDVEDPDSLLSLGLDAISVDVMSGDPATYRELMGLDRAASIREHLLALMSARGQGLRRPWIVARFTRCDAVYEELESLYDFWTMHADACVIDPLPHVVTGQRIEPLETPRQARSRIAASRLFVRCDGVVKADRFGESVGSLNDTRLDELWRRVQRLGHEGRSAA